jgi:hypothetical protein
MLVQFDAASLLEAGMLLCFGASWPISMLKTLRTKVVAGKSLGFLALVLAGYLSGIGAKVAIAVGRGEPLAWVSALYTLNGLMVATDIVLYLRYSRRRSAVKAG